jgi:hypothetical protein
MPEAAISDFCRSPTSHHGPWLRILPVTSSFHLFSTTATVSLESTTDLKWKNFVNYIPKEPGELTYFLEELA